MAKLAEKRGHDSGRIAAGGKLGAASGSDISEPIRTLQKCSSGFGHITDYRHSFIMASRTARISFLGQ